MFYTLIGPADLPIPLWKTIAGQVSQQGLQLKVVGTWDDPKIEREAVAGRQRHVGTDSDRNPGRRRHDDAVDRRRAAIAPAQRPGEYKERLP